MKKLFLACCIVVLLVLAITKSSNAQNLNSMVKPGLQSFTENPTSSSPEKSALRDSDSLRLNELNAKAVRNFMEDFKNVPDARWIKSVNGLFVAYFVTDKIQNFIVYNARGNRESIIRYYYEEELPRDVRHLIKTTYYDFSIFCINELTVKEVTAYVVTLRSSANEKTFWKVVNVVDGEMEIMKEYSQKTDQED